MEKKVEDVSVKYKCVSLLKMGANTVGVNLVFACFSCCVMYNCTWKVVFLKFSCICTHCKPATFVMMNLLQGDFCDG